MDVHVGAAAQEGRLARGRQHQTDRREREAGPGGTSGAHAGEVDDDRPVHADGRLVNMKAGHVGRQQARHGHGDVECAGGEVVVGDRCGGRASVRGRRILLVGAKRRAEPGRAEPEVGADRGRERRVVDRVVDAVAAVDRAAQVDAIGEHDRVVAVSRS